MKIVVLDGYTVNPGDVNWDPILSMGEVEIYDRSEEGEIVSRCSNVDVVVVNKVKISSQHFEQLPDLKAVCLLATGFDNVDISAAKQNGVAVYNAVGYGSESVAQHTLAMILAWTNRVESHHKSVMRGDWSAQPDFSFSLHTVAELKGKTIGIIGYGKIGKRVGELARAFGMKVLATNSGSAQQDESITDLHNLLAKSHFISLHVPLSEDTRYLIDDESLRRMRSDAVIINCGRGGLIHEWDLVDAVEHGQIAGAILDVLSVEPPCAGHPLFYHKNIWITPHMAWRSLEARNALIQIVSENIRGFLEGSDVNRVV